nr:cuticle protein AMP3-like [Procambarus clarkii]
MKLTLLICLVVVAAAAPDKNAQTVLDERNDSGDGNFHYNFQTSNGISSQKIGNPGSEGQSNFQGSFRFSLPDGNVAELTYVANEYGYQPVSNLLPTPHPLPDHVYELLRIAEEQRRKGITFDK